MITEYIGKDMKIKTIKIKGFKRFTDLIITDIPESARLVILVGPNGSGKTSLFESFNYWYIFRLLEISAIENI